MRNDLTPSPAPRGDLPDTNATGAPEGVPGASDGAPGRETAEREAAWRRGRQASADPGGGAAGRDPYTGLAAPAVAHRAFAALAENVRDFAIFLMDPDGIITFWGEGARLIKWWTRDEAEGAHLRLLYPDGGSGDGTAEEHLREAAETGEYTGEGQRIRGDCSTFWAGVSLTALRDTGGELIGFAKVTRDLTARRAADAALKAARDEAEEARRRAEEANRTKSLFLATMSHEIRTPINAVMGYVDLLTLELAGPLTEKQRHQLGRIRASNMHLLGIIDDILEFSRLDAGRSQVARRAGRLGAPIEAAVQMVQMQAEARGVALAESGSGLAADVPYWGDEDRVRQVLVVLLSNAVKFTPRGGRITVSAGTAEHPPADARLEGPGPWAYVRVEDTGPGIPPGRLAAIFELFEQADMTLTRQHGGTGLGLTIARRLAVLMDGDLTVRSREGMGSAFFLWLPAAPELTVEHELADGMVDAPAPGLLQQIRDAILLELERVLHVYVARLRSDPATPSAHHLGEAELEDHLATFLSDLAVTFSAMDLAANDQPEEMRDSTAIQRTIAERHGSQRRRLGWTGDEIHREFRILREEVAAAVRRRVHGLPPDEMEESLAAVGLFIETAERVSLASYHQAAG
ncbi:MAG TPA: ATP-binding protein [Longimicrobium sp.]|nr:ATP-binding protein [Longimicrobium sp.]